MNLKDCSGLTTLHQDSISSFYNFHSSNSSIIFMNRTTAYFVSKVHCNSGIMNGDLGPNNMYGDNCINLVNLLGNLFFVYEYALKTKRTNAQHVWTSCTNLCNMYGFKITLWMHDWITNNNCVSKNTNLVCLVITNLVNVIHNNNMPNEYLLF